MKVRNERLPVGRLKDILSYDSKSGHIRWRAGHRASADSPPMKILALDLGRRTGWACGEAGSIPESGSIVLRKPNDQNGLALGTLARWLGSHVYKQGKPDLFVVERWLPPSVQKSHSVVEDSLRMNGVCHAIAGIYGITIVEPFPATVRAAVCGRAHDPAGTKQMVIRTAALLGLIPKDCHDDNRADAACLWSWAEATYGRVAPKEFALTS